MRILLNFIFTISLLMPVNLYAEAPIFFSDVSAGVFRFQIKLAEQGNPEAQYKVGEMYELGKGVPTDLDKAKLWYEKSAAQDHKKAYYKLLFLDIRTNGINDTSKTKLGVLRQEAASGNADAQYFLGKMYAGGIGVDKDLTNALTWLNEAKFNGIPEAEHEAIAVEEELVRVREARAIQQAQAEKEQKLKEEEKQQALKQKRAEERRQAEAEKRRQAQQAQQDQARRSTADKNADKKLEQERSAQTAQQARLEKIRQESAKSAAAEQAEKKAAKEDKADNNKPGFESDPCKGKQARFLSTCK